MPARGWKKTDAKSRVIKLRVEPEFADRVVARAGKSGGSVSKALRYAVNMGLDAIEREEKGVGAGGLLRVELTDAEEEARAQQLRWAEHAHRRKEATKKNVEILKERILDLLRHRGACDWWDLVHGLGPMRETALLNAALSALLYRNQIVRLVSKDDDGKRTNHFALIPDGEDRTPGAAFRPSELNRADEIYAVAVGIRRFRRKALREVFGWDDRQVSAALVVLIAQGRVERIAHGVYRAVRD